jgi:hypothetical protein
MSFGSRRVKVAKRTSIIGSKSRYRDNGDLWRSRIVLHQETSRVSSVARSHLLTLENGQRRTIRGWKEIAAKEERSDELRAATSINKRVETHTAGALTIAVVAALDRANADSFAASNTTVPRAYATSRSR